MNRNCEATWKIYNQLSFYILDKIFNNQNLSDKEIVV